MDSIHIRSDSNYKKIDKNGAVLVSTAISNVSVIAGYPVVEDDKGNYIYIGDNGCVDSNNNTHVVLEEVKEKIWQSGRHYEVFWFYTIYYSKIDSNNTVLIDNMCIDTDGKPSWEMNPPQVMWGWWFLYAVVPVLVVIIVIVVIIIFILRSRKSEKSRKEKKQAKHHLQNRSTRHLGKKRF